MLKPGAPLSWLSESQRSSLLADIYYLNMLELRRFCDSHEIPYLIRIEKNGLIVRTRDPDRKGIVVERIVRFLKTGEIAAPSVFASAVIADSDLARKPRPSDRVYYGQYKNVAGAALDLMKRLTGGKFEFGAISQIVIREAWTRGIAPTFEEFARMWEAASVAHTRPNPEWAYLTDLNRGTAGPNWKQLRNQKAAAVMRLLDQIATHASGKSPAKAGAT